MSRRPRRTKAELREAMEAAVKAAFEDASSYIDTDIAPARERAQLYYDGAPYGDEEDGRSQVVLTEVRDTILQMMPSLLRVFAGSERYLEFLPRNKEDVAAAEQATAVVEDILGVQNPGFQLFHDLLKDALLLKTGVAKFWHEDAEEITEEEYTGLTVQQVRAFLLDDPEVEVVEGSVEITGTDPRLMPAGFLPPELADNLAAEMEDADPLPGLLAVAEGAEIPPAAPPGMPPGSALPPVAPGMVPPTMAVAGMGPMVPPPPPPSEVALDLRVRRTRRSGRIRVAALPPEEFIISRSARSVEKADYCAHRCIRTVSDLVAMGYDRDELAEHAGHDDMLSPTGHDAELARNPAAYNHVASSDADPSQARVLYVEHYIRFGTDDSGLAALHRVCTVGGACHVMHDEVVSEAPFALWCPDPVPHSAIGNSVADQIMDVQRIKSHILRRTLDSLSQSIHPRTTVVEGQVNLDDALNIETGAIIRQKAPGMVGTLETPFVGQFSLPILTYFDEIKAARTGISQASAGLDPAVLQSTTKAAVTATVTAAQERTEMVARVLAETGAKALAKGILRLVCRHADKPRTMRLTGKWTDVDPRSWDAEMDCAVNVGLGRGDAAQRMGFLSMIAGKQEQLLAQLGPVNPVVSAVNWRNTMAEVMAAAGYKDADRYFKPVTEQDVAQAAAAKQPPQDPAAMLAQIEVAKAQADLEAARGKLELERERMRLEDDRERDRMAQEFELKRAEIAARYGAAVDAAALRAEMERDREMLAQIGAYAQHVVPGAPPAPQPPMPPAMPPGAGY